MGEIQCGYSVDLLAVLMECGRSGATGLVARSPACWSSVGVCIHSSYTICTRSVPDQSIRSGDGFSTVIGTIWVYAMYLPCEVPVQHAVPYHEAVITSVRGRASEPVSAAAATVWKEANAFLANSAA